MDLLTAPPAVILLGYFEIALQQIDNWQISALPYEIEKVSSTIQLVGQASLPAIDARCAPPSRALNSKYSRDLPTLGSAIAATI